MGWQAILALVLIIPVVLIPVALVWYINFSGIRLALKESRARKANKDKDKKQTVATKV